MRAYTLLLAAMLLFSAVHTTTAVTCGPNDIGECVASGPCSGPKPISMGKRDCKGDTAECCVPDTPCGATNQGVCRLAAQCDASTHVVTDISQAQHHPCPPDSFLWAAQSANLRCCMPKPTEDRHCQGAVSPFTSRQGFCDAECTEDEMPLAKSHLSTLCTDKDHQCCYPATCTRGTCTSSDCPSTHREAPALSGECATNYKCCRDRPRDGDRKTYHYAKATEPNGDRTTTLVSAYKYPATTSGVPVTEDCFELALLLLRSRQLKDAASCMVGVAKIKGALYYATSRDECSGPKAVVVDFYGTQKTITLVDYATQTADIGSTAFHDGGRWTCAAAQLQYAAKLQGSTLQCLVEMYRRGYTVVKSCSRCENRLASPKFVVRGGGRL